MSNGAMTNSTYPYTGKDGTCKYSSSKGKVKTGGSISVSGNPTSMMSALKGGPMSVSINASSQGFQTYKSGVLSGSCSTSTNHSVALVGYETSAKTPYWIVRNSWGSSWGQKGFIWMKQSTGDGQCGINHSPRYPSIK